MIKVGKFRQDFCLLFYFIAVFAFMPTNLTSDRQIWMFASFLLLISTGIDALAGKTKIYLYNCCISYIVLVAFGILSMVWSSNTALTVNYLLTKFLFILAGALCVSSYMKDEEDAEHVIMLMIASACIASVRFCYYTPWDRYLRGSFGLLLDPNTNYNSYTTPLSLAFVLSAYYALKGKRKLCLFAMLFLAAVLLLGGSRKSIVLIPLTMIFFTLNKTNVKRALKGCLVVIIVLACGLYAVQNIPQLSSVQKSLTNAYNAFILGERTGIGNSTEGRIYLMQAAREVWMSHPLLGVGWNNFRYNNSLGLYAHNNYYETLASLGIVGFLLYYSIHLRVLVHLFTKRKKETVPYSQMVSGVVFAMLFLEIGALPIYSREVMLLYLTILASYERISGQRIKRLRIKG